LAIDFVLPQIKYPNLNKHKKLNPVKKKKTPALEAKIQPTPLTELQNKKP
jgi:hypothetical protein